MHIDVCVFLPLQGGGDGAAGLDMLVLSASQHIEVAAAMEMVSLDY